MKKQHETQPIKTFLMSLVLGGVVIISMSLLTAGTITKKAQLAAASTPTTMSGIGDILGTIVNDVVQDIRAQHPQSGITQAHVLAIMCQELPSLQINGSNSEGRQEGFTQVISSTYRGLVSGRTAQGACAYTAQLEQGQVGGPCSSLEARTQNARCSIEVGACLYDYLLSQCKGDVACAYNAYNTGSYSRRANGLTDFVQGYQSFANGQVCAKSAHNSQVWSGIMRTVGKFTKGTFASSQAMFIPVARRNLTNTNGPLLVTPSLRTFTNTSSNTYTTPANYKYQARPLQNAAPQARAQPKSADATSVPVAPQAPKLVCLPGKITLHETAIIAWACGGNKAHTQGTNFKTKGKPYGMVRVTPRETTRYTLDCASQDTLQKAQCTIIVDTTKTI